MIVPPGTEARAVGYTVQSVADDGQGPGWAWVDPAGVMSDDCHGSEADAWKAADCEAQIWIDGG